MMKSLCVYLGAKPAKNHAFTDAAVTLGRVIAEHNLHLIYGGSSQGLMGTLALSALEAGARVTGIIPKMLLEQEVPLDTLEDLMITDTMQERKLLLQQHADAFLVMPGGLGTLEEAFETWNAIKIGLMDKPMGFLNIHGFYDSLLTFMTHGEQHGFVPSEALKKLHLAAEPKALVEALCTAK